MKRFLLTTRCLLLAALTGGGFAPTTPGSEPSAAPAADTATATVTTNPPAAAANAASNVVDEAELKDLLTAALQKDYIRDAGQLELRLTRPWTALTATHLPVTVNILDVPTTGVSPNFIVRFELRDAGDSLGVWQMPVQAHVWRDVWVARSPLKPGELLTEVDRARERRDILAMRDSGLGDIADESLYQMAEYVPTGAPLYASSIKLRTLVRRGQLAEAVVQDGALSVSLKVEVLEDGVLGQYVLVRNPVSKREFRGKVQDEQTILVDL